MMARVNSILASLFLVLGLTGCLGSAPSTRLYQFESGADKGGKEATGNTPTLLVREVRLPAYLDRPQIVTRGAGHRLHIAEFDQWGGDLREDMTRVLVKHLGRALGSQRVFATPVGIALQPDYRLEVEVLRFEREADGQVRLHARWWLARGADLGLLATHEASFSRASSNDSYPDLVATMTMVYAELVDAIAASIRKLGGA